MIIGLILVYMMLHLAIALAIGFWLLITAIKQEGWLKILGSVFGWIIISLAIISSIITCYSVIKYRNAMTKPCPMYEMMRQGRMHQDMMDREEMPMMNGKQQRGMMNQQPCPNCPHENQNSEKQEK